MKLLIVTALSALVLSVPAQPAMAGLSDGGLKTLSALAN